MHKKRKWLSFLVPILLIAVGAGIFLYPAISNWYMEQQQQHVIHEYQAKVNKQQAKDLAKLWKAAITYNENLSGDPVHDPFVEGSGYVLPRDYKKVLNVSNDGVMGNLKIAKINVFLPIYHGCGEEALSKGAGHLEGTSLPIGSKSQHTVLCAHRGLPSAQLFTRLDELKKGDLFEIEVLDKRLYYKIDAIEVVEPKEVEKLHITPNKEYVTLMTCTPYGVNTHRLLVRGVRTDDQESVIKTDSNHKQNTWQSWMLLGTGLGLLIVLVCYYGRKKRKRLKNEG